MLIKKNKYFNHTNIKTIMLTVQSFPYARKYSGRQFTYARKILGKQITSKIYIRTQLTVAPHNLVTLIDIRNTVFTCADRWKTLCIIDFMIMSPADINGYKKKLHDQVIEQIFDSSKYR